MLRNTFLFALLLSAAASLAQGPGSIDATFMPLKWSITCTAVQADGKLVVAGDFTTVAGLARVGLVRFDTDGAVDPTFDPGAGVNGKVHALRVQGDGKILIAGSFTTVGGAARAGVARLNVNGTVDAGFDPGLGATSAVGADAAVYAMAVQTDGKILVGGAFAQMGGVARPKLARLLTTGALDIGFVPNTIMVGGGTKIMAVAVKSDGKVLAGGDISKFLIGLNSNGSDDAAFVGDAKLNGAVYGITISGANTFVCGAFSAYNGIGLLHIAKLTSTGLAVAGFKWMGVGGVISFSGGVKSMVVRSDGKIYISGVLLPVPGGDTKSGIELLLPTGVNDPSFRPVQVGTPNETIACMTPLVGNAMFVAGSFATFDQKSINSLVYLDANGKVDNSYYPGGGVAGYVSALALQPDGKIIVGGLFTKYNSTVCNNLVRVDRTGYVDPGFTLGAGFSSVVSALALQPDGKIIVGGNFSTALGTARNGLARLLPNGALDPAFSVGTGFDLIDSTYTSSGNPRIASVKAIVVQPDGKIIVGGNFHTVNGTANRYVVRLNSDGSVDATYTHGGYFNGSVDALALKPDGKVIVGGSFAPGLARLNTNGSVDNTFTGTVNTSRVTSLSLFPDGKFLMGGGFTTIGANAAIGVAKRGLNGGNSADFPCHTLLTPPAATTPMLVRCVSLLSNGMALVGGNFTVQGVQSQGLMRLTVDGLRDATFYTTPGFTSGSVNALAVQPDGMVIAAGQFAVYNGTPRHGIVRLKP